MNAIALSVFAQEPQFRQGGTICDVVVLWMAFIIIVIASSRAWQERHNRKQADDPDEKK